MEHFTGRALSPTTLMLDNSTKPIQLAFPSDSDQRLVPGRKYVVNGERMTVVLVGEVHEQLEMG